MVMDQANKTLLQQRENLQVGRRFDTFAAAMLSSADQTCNIFDCLSARWVRI
jgi:hypothetical protein